MEDANYSILKFCPDITIKEKNYIYEAIKKGKKVFFFTFNDIDEMLEDSFLKEANDRGLFYLYMVRFDDRWENRVVLYLDGEFTDPFFLDFLENNSTFNKDQYILEHYNKASNLIIKAGAGTGKTATMINRILYMKHMSPQLDFESIVMITFTNEASSNMRNKLLEKLKAYYDFTRDLKYLEWMEEIRTIFIGTIHSFAKEYLTKEGQKLGFSRLMKVRSYRYNQKQLIEKYIDVFSVSHSEVYDNVRFIPHYLIVNSFMELIEKINNKSLSAEEIMNLDFGLDSRGISRFINDVIKNVLGELAEIKKKEHTLEVSDLISQLGLIRTVPNETITMKIDYLFVDEFQDTDESQVAFVSWLADKYNCKLFVVGDTKQSIYRFRGADYTAFVQLKEHLNDSNHQFAEYSLRKNYRSEQRLIKQFNHLFQKWTNRVEHFDYNETDQLIPVIADTDGEGLKVLPLDDVNLKRILNRLFQQDTAVLVRSNHQVMAAVERIENMGFFCDAVVAGAFYRSLPVREFYLLIRYMTHPQVPKERYLLHQSSYGENELTITEVLNSFTYDKPFILDALEPYDYFIKTFTQAYSQSLIDVFQKIIEKIKPNEVFRKRYYKELRRRFPEADIQTQKAEALAKMKEYKANLEKLIFLLKRELGDTHPSLYDYEKFLSLKMATDYTENEWKLETNVTHRIKVMTVHKAKGLEFDYVLMPITTTPFIQNNRTEILLIEEDKWKLGYSIQWRDQDFVNNHFFNFKGSENFEMIAEEARLLYVALTRAKKGTYVDGSSYANPYSVQSWKDLLGKEVMQGVSN